MCFNFFLFIPSLNAATCASISFSLFLRAAAAVLPNAYDPSNPSVVFLTDSSNSAVSAIPPALSVANVTPHVPPCLLCPPVPSILLLFIFYYYLHVLFLKI